MLKSDFSVIGLSETWLTDETSDLYSINGYSFEPVCRKNKSGGGVAICVKSGISYVIRNDLCVSNESLECVFIGISFNSCKNIIVAVVYWPPNTDMDVFNDNMLTILDKLKNERKICYLSGDFNINCFKSDEHKRTSDFLDLMYSHSYIPLITRPTRVTVKSATLIDNIYTNNLQGIQSTMSGLLTTDISDHYPIFHIYPELIEKEKEIYFWRRCLNATNKNKFIELISDEDWSDVFNNDEAQSAFTDFHIKLKQLYDIAFPQKKIKRGYNNRKPWLSDELRSAIKHKN